MTAPRHVSDILASRAAVVDEATLRAWIAELVGADRAELGVRAAIAAARVALAVWERAVPWSWAPHDRIAAAEAWLACPCAAHADGAASLAYANGDDNPIKGWSELRVDGRSVTDGGATFAHWSSDATVSAAWCAACAREHTAVAAGTAAGGAVSALVRTGLGVDEAFRAVVDAIAAALAAFGDIAIAGGEPADRSDAMAGSDAPDGAAPYEPPIVLPLRGPAYVVDEKRIAHVRAEPDLVRFELALRPVIAAMTEGRVVRTTECTTRIEKLPVGRGSARIHDWSGPGFEARLSFVSESVPFSGMEYAWRAEVVVGERFVSAWVDAFDPGDYVAEVRASGPTPFAHLLAEAMQAAWGAP